MLSHSSGHAHIVQQACLGVCQLAIICPVTAHCLCPYSCLPNTSKLWMNRYYKGLVPKSVQTHSPNAHMATLLSVLIRCLTRTPTQTRRPLSSLLGTPKIQQLLKRRGIWAHTEPHSPWLLLLLQRYVSVS